MRHSAEAASIDFIGGREASFWIDRGPLPTLRSAALGCPICLCTVVLVGSSPAVSVSPRVIAERRGVLQLSFGDAGAVSVETGVVFERRPWDRIVAVRETQKAA